MIEKYIQFAIDNGYKKDFFGEHQEDGYWKFDYLDIHIQFYIIDRFGDEDIRQEQGIIACITSKPFIEAIARGLKKQKYSNDDYGTLNIRKIVERQGLAIFDNELGTFITNLLK